jgi:hypothetical protein
MDEDFEYFLEKMGPAFDAERVPPSSFEHYRGKLPDQLLKYWKEYGWCGYADGLFWTVDPHAYEPALEAWIGNTPFMEQDAYHVIARSAFGDLYFWGEQTGLTLKICSLGSYAVPQSRTRHSLEKHIQIFFGSCNREENDFGDYFARALKKLGRLKPDEMYRAGPAKLNSPISVDTAPEGEDIARENWSKYEQKTPPHALSGLQSQGGAGRRSRRQDAGRVGAAA